jgi:TatD DNase family protein
VALVDSHCHLDDEQFESSIEDVVARAGQAGVETILTVGTTLSSSLRSVAIAEQFSAVYAAVGIHPNSCGEAAPGDWDRVVELAAHPRAVALGETGLDRYWDRVPLPQQQDYFDRHLRLSLQCGLPFIVHMRDCDADVLAMLEAARRRGALRGVMHSFTGTEATARACLDLGMYISFAGMVTYKKSEELRAIAAGIPQDRILIETDAPYLSPHPHRAVRPNEPSLIVHTAKCLAGVRGVSSEEFAEQTTRNARALFGFA